MFQTFLMIITARRYPSTVLGVAILSVRPSVFLSHTSRSN